MVMEFNKNNHVTGTGFDTMKARAEALTKTSPPEDIESLLNEATGLGRIGLNKVMQIIKDGTGMSLGVLREALSTGHTKEREPDHLALAREVIDRKGAQNLLCTASQVWVWREEGLWQLVHDREIKQDVQRMLDDRRHPVSRGTVDSVTDVLKTEIHAPAHQWDVHQDAINVLNGELHRKDSGWEVEPHCREHYRTTQIPHEADETAECPRFRQFLEEVFMYDPDGQEKKLAVLEMIGYTLVSHARFERFILLIGSGANGKSVLLEIIRMLVGTHNVAAVQPSKFGNPFQRAHLHMKLANLVTEIEEGGVIADAELKAIVSGELSTVEHKHQTPFSFRPFCTCWFGTNHMPHTKDFSDALFRRATIITFNRKFEGADADPDLKNKLAAELPGILKLSLQAFDGVLNRGMFTEPESSIIAKQQWRTEADQVAQFVGEMCILDENACTSSRELYDAYQAWARSAGIKRQLGRIKFTERIERCGGEQDRGTGGTRMIAGIRLHPRPPFAFS